MFTMPPKKAKGLKAKTGENRMLFWGVFILVGYGSAEKITWEFSLVTKHSQGDYYKYLHKYDDDDDDDDAGGGGGGGGDGGGDAGGGGGGGGGDDDEEEEEDSPTTEKFNEQKSRALHPMKTTWSNGIFVIGLFESRLQPGASRISYRNSTTRVISSANPKTLDLQT